MFPRWIRRASPVILCAALVALSGCEVKAPPPAKREKPAPPRVPAKPPPAISPVETPAAVQEARANVPETSFSMIRAEGAGFFNADGNRVTLRGCNLGNWLLLEMWMLDLQGIKDQHEFEAILAKRFGAEGRDKLLGLYRAHYITERDFPIIRSFGFNTVRLPFEYRLVEDEDQPGRLRRDAFRWLDRAVHLAEAHGLRVILDLHGAPGRQSVDHTTGRTGQNHLWTDAAAQDRTVALWKEMAIHYRDNPVIAGYDLVNEPFGDMKTPAHHAPLVALVDRVHDAIRSVDTNHVIFIPGTLQGIEFYGDPREREWRNVAFTEHYYPGLFGSEPTLDTHARFISQRIPARAAYLRNFQVPLLVGEFNVVLDQLKAPVLMRRYFDEYEARGWAATMWSYKLLRKKGGASNSFWGMVANKEPMPEVDIRKAAFEEVAAWFSSFGSMEYDVNEALRGQLTAEVPEDPGLKVYEWINEPSARDDIPGWRAEDIGGALAGGQQRISTHAVEIYGGGADIWGTSDQFRFLWKEASGNLRLTARIDELYDTDKHAKAGLMLRNSMASNSAHVLVHVFPDGQLNLGWRASSGAVMEEIKVAQVGFPVHLRIERRGAEVTLYHGKNGSDWTPVPLPVAVDLNTRLAAGLAVLAHDGNRSLTRATFSEIDLLP